MAAFYTPIEADYLKAQRMEREPGIDLFKCKDGLWRTADEKDAFDREATFALPNGEQQSEAI